MHIDLMPNAQGTLIWLVAKQAEHVRVCTVCFGERECDGGDILEPTAARNQAYGDRYSCGGSSHRVHGCSVRVSSIREDPGVTICVLPMLSCAVSSLEPPGQPVDWAV